MAENTKIEWADHTFNPWIGCTKVSPACDHCYAETQTKRFDPDTDLWSGGRRRTSSDYWRHPLKWNRQAAEFRAQHGRPPMVFCASLADVFDNQVPEEWRRDLWSLIYETPDLIWLLLTKRPQNIRKMLPASYLGLTDRGWPAMRNVWLGTTVENQTEADRRIPHLLAAPAAKRFLSCEPLLGPVDLGSRLGGTLWMGGQRGCDGTHAHRGSSEPHDHGDHVRPASAPDNMRHHHHDDRCGAGIDWVIAGGESGHDARPSHPDWFRSLRDQCAAAGVPFLFKQWGAFLPARQTLPEFGKVHGGTAVAPGRMKLHYTPASSAPVQHAFAERGVEFAAIGDLLTFRVGTKPAGRLLDGVIHDARPDDLPALQPPVTGHEKRSLI